MDKIKRKIYLNKIIDFMNNDFPLLKNLKDYGFYDQLSNDELIYVFSGVFKQPVKIKEKNDDELNELDIFNQNGNTIYLEDSDSYWVKYEYDENNNRTYLRYSDGYWVKYEYNKNGNEIYFEDSDGYWRKKEYDENNNLTYSENSLGYWV